MHNHGGDGDCPSYKQLKLPALKVGDRGFEPHSGLQVSKKQTVSSPLTRKAAILWGASVTVR